MVWFNVGLELRCGLLPMAWYSSRRMIRRRAITVLIRHGGDGPPPGTARSIIWMGTWRTLHPRRILHAPGAISVHVSISPGESRTWALWSRIFDHPVSYNVVNHLKMCHMVTNSIFYNYLVFCRNCINIYRVIIFLLKNTIFFLLTEMIYI